MNKKNIESTCNPESASSELLSAVYEINGYGIVLPLVQNYYPVEDNEAGGFCWGFKYASGVFEFFHYKQKTRAERERGSFIFALNTWHISGR